VFLSDLCVLVVFMQDAIFKLSQNGTINQNDKNRTFDPLK